MSKRVRSDIDDVVTNRQRPLNLERHFHFDIRYEPNSNRPSVITVTPIVTASTLDWTDIDWIHAAHSVLMTTIHQSIYQYNGWNYYTQDMRAIGTLQMRNVIESDRSAHELNIHLRNLTTNQMETTFYRATRDSNRDLTGNEIEWGFWINPRSLLIGGGRNIKKVAGLYNLTCENYPDLSCAAVAIICWLIMNSTLYPPSIKKNLNRSKTILFDEARRLQSIMNWQKYTTKSEVLDIVNIYQDYRVVIVNFLTPSSASDSRNGLNYRQDPSNSRIIYLYYDYQNKHFAAIESPQRFIREQTKQRYHIWCHDCTSFRCNCNQPKSRHKKEICHHCKLNTYGIQHNCFYQSCNDCHLEYKAGKEMDDHRCPIRSKKFSPDFESGEPKAKELWAYDFESAITFDPNDDSSFKFPTDAEGFYEFENEIPPDNEFTPKNIITHSHKQVPNFVVYKNVFTGERRETESIREFLEDMLFKTNKGNNTLVAHNAQGYDSRLIFDEMNLMTGVQNKIISRGSKILRMEVGKTLFLDSMLHLSGSLNSLADDYLKGNAAFESMEKGYFPHLFNTPENRHYIGPTPDIEYYDLSSFCNDEKQLKKFFAYYDSIKDRQDWNFWEELTKYCRQDVEILATIMKIFHDQCMHGLGLYSPHLKTSPWHYTTVPGYVYSLFLKNNDLDAADLPPTLRAKDSWCVQKPTEHYFARKALRGGRTETRIHFYEGAILDVDINSQYPSVQMAKDIELCDSTLPILYPTGYPTIEIHDSDYYPCNLHYENPDEVCSCTLEIKQQYKSIKLDILNTNVTSLHDYINNFFGFIMVDATPPTNLYHPVLPVYNKETNKCTFSLLPIIRGTYCTPELQLAIKKGYTITKIYRADRYKSETTPWGGEDGGLLGVFLKMKIMNSSKVPPPEEQIKWAKYYKEKFDMTLDFTPHLWDKRLAAKKTSKIFANSIWGKGAETVDHEQVKIVTPETYNDADLMMQSFTDGQNNMTGFLPLANDNMMIKYKANRHKNPPDLSKAYLPCSAFVPMYGRLMLYNVLDKYKERVIMMDTDSIKVIADGPQITDIPFGNCLGQWEDEYDPALGRLVGFISLGPKTYGQKFDSGKTTFKSKGVSLRRAHEKIINYEIAKEIYFENKVVSVPQTVFSYQFSKGIHVRRFLKKIQFNEKELKGKLDRSTHRLYPFGFIDYA